MNGRIEIFDTPPLHYYVVGWVGLGWVGIGMGKAFWVGYLLRNQMLNDQMIE